MVKAEAYNKARADEMKNMCLSQVQEKSNEESGDLRKSAVTKDDDKAEQVYATMDKSPTTVYKNMMFTSKFARKFVEASGSNQVSARSGGIDNSQSMESFAR